MNPDEVKDRTYILLEREKPKSLTVQQICSKLGFEDEVGVTISLGKLEIEKKVIEDDYQKIYREDGGVILLPKFRIATESEFK
ncbi:MAG: hypothetical protein A7315_05215 [Candidatus Altiarchaeales archaeon WOR_SM1_79]|nr:MAG: hypothetical protein A7315_05215 [Candidatus Altiarchaeales archaeon WOR_SM1_79]